LAVLAELTDGGHRYQDLHDALDSVSEVLPGLKRRRRVMMRRSLSNPERRERAFVLAHLES